MLVDTKVFPIDSIHMQASVLTTDADFGTDIWQQQILYNNNYSESLWQRIHHRLYDKTQITCVHDIAILWGLL